MRCRLLVDPHVHRYRCHDPDRWLDAASRNMRQIDPEAVHCLILTETTSEDSVQALQSGVTRWRPSSAAELGSLVFQRDGAAVFVIEGHQINTAERLEVLALGVTEAFEEGLPIDRALERVREQGGIAVLPWGVGKWEDRRREIVASLIDRASPGELFVGDNGNRPAPWPMPRLITRAVRKGLFNLPGSDPLRLRSHEDRAGSYGFAIEGDFDEQRPMDSIRAMLAGCRSSPRVWGRRANWMGFAVSQVALRLTKA